MNYENDYLLKYLKYKKKYLYKKNIQIGGAFNLKITMINTDQKTINISVDETDTILSIKKKNTR